MTRIGLGVALALPAVACGSDARDRSRDDELKLRLDPEAPYAPPVPPPPPPPPGSLLPERAPAPVLQFTERVVGAVAPYQVVFSNPANAKDRARTLGGDGAEALIKALADRTSYWLGVTPACTSDAGLALELRRGDIALELRYDCGRLDWAPWDDGPDAFLSEHVANMLVDADRAATATR